MKRKLVFLPVIIAFVLLGCASTGQAAPISGADLYRAAMIDSMIAEQDEILPLVNISPEDPLTTWKDGKTLLLSFHRFPDSYIAGTDYVTKYGEVWTFTDKEMIKWFRENRTRRELAAASVSDWTFRFNQLLGLPEDRDYTHVSAMWADPADVKRPAFETGITRQVTGVKLPPDADPSYKEWFNGNIIWSYFDSAYPWTRLGYTYDWADNGTEYGLSEFLIQKNATVQVEWTRTIGEFIDWLGAQ
ncbi:hypothetical protein AGMMS50268_15260 [Spirochaetia bacterium]|nr:hypothetical protein AGMMS50268_15260 [Spirochaetia bacterium]